MVNDTYCTADNKSRTLLVQLDLSAAFDTIYHSTLLQRLECTFGLSDSVIRLVQWYISGRSQYVHVGQKQSTAVLCVYGVPQGSALGPLLYTLYVAPVASFIASFDVNHMQFAYDTKLYIALENDNATISLNNCFIAVNNVGSPVIHLVHR